MFERIRKSDRARSSDGGPRNECAARIHDRGWTKVVPREAMNVLVPGPIVFGVVTMVVRVQVPRRSRNRRARRNPRCPEQSLRIFPNMLWCVSFFPECSVVGGVVSFESVSSCIGCRFSVYQSSIVRVANVCACVYVMD